MARCRWGQHPGDGALSRCRYSTARKWRGPRQGAGGAAASATTADREPAAAPCPQSRAHDRRYHEQEHVNGSGRRLPPQGVVPAAARAGRLIVLPPKRWSSLGRYGQEPLARATPAEGEPPQREPAPGAVGGAAAVGDGFRTARGRGARRPSGLAARGSCSHSA
jgi:hypothetical protein